MPYTPLDANLIWSFFNRGFREVERCYLDFSQLMEEGRRCRSRHAELFRWRNVDCSRLPEQVYIYRFRFCFDAFGRGDFSVRGTEHTTKKLLWLYVGAFVLLCFCFLKSFPLSDYRLSEWFKTNEQMIWQMNKCRLCYRFKHYYCSFVLLFLEPERSALKSDAQNQDNFEFWILTGERDSTND